MMRRPGRAARDSLNSSLERIARVISDRYDINVVFHKDDCYTDGRTIVLPSVPASADADFLQALEGKLDHEAGHIIFTDWDAVNRSAEHPQLKWWTNVLEDARIEACICEAWPGCRANLEFTQRWLLEKDLDEWHSFDKENKEAKLAILYAKGYGSWFLEIPDAESMFKEAWEDILPALGLAAKQESAFHSLALAIWVMDTIDPDWREAGREGLAPFVRSSEELDELLRTLAGAERELARIGRGGKVIEGEGGSGSTDRFSEASRRARIEEEAGERYGHGITRSFLEKYDGTDREERKRRSLARTGGMGGRPAEHGPRSTDDFGSKALSGVAGDIRHRIGVPGSEHYVPATTEDDVIQLQWDGNLHWFQTNLQEVRKMSGAMSRRLRMVMMSKAYPSTEYEKHSGRLNVRSLPRFLMTGNPRCFKQRSRGEELCARATLLVDESGSMHGTRIQEARRAAILFGEFCEQLGIPFEILGFSTTSTGHEQKRYDRAAPEDKSYYTRWGNHLLLVYKRFDEQWRRVGHRIQHMSGRDQNYDGESVQIAAQRLLMAAQPGERKLLFVFSDGSPVQSIYEHADAHQEYLRTVTGYLPEVGIEAIGIGICTEAVKHYYPNWVVINDPRQLSGAQMSKLREVFLESKKPKRRRAR